MYILYSNYKRAIKYVSFIVKYVPFNIKDNDFKKNEQKETPSSSSLSQFIAFDLLIIFVYLKPKTYGHDRPLLNNALHIPYVYYF